MNGLLILLLVVVGAVYWQRHKAPQLVMPVLFGVILLVLVLAGARLFCSGPGKASLSETLDIAEAFDRAAAFRLGQVVAQEVPSGSDILVVHPGLTHEVATRMVESKVAALKEALGDSYTLFLEGPSREDVRLDPDGDPIDSPHLDGELFLTFLERHPDVDAVVSFFGAPNFRSRPPETLPPLYAMGGVDDRLFDRLPPGVLKARVAYREENVDWKARPRWGMSNEEIFDLRFRLIRGDR